MRVLLINPNRYSNPPVPPIGLEYLSASLIEQGINILRGKPSRSDLAQDSFDVVKIDDRTLKTCERGGDVGLKATPVRPQEGLLFGGLRFEHPDDGSAGLFYPGDQLVWPLKKKDIGVHVDDLFCC